MVVELTREEVEVARLAREVQALQLTLGTLLSWLPQSANAPIRADEAKRLIDMLHGKPSWS